MNKTEEVFRKIMKEHGWMDFVTPIYWDGKMKNPVKKLYKISIVTTCMNRMEDLKKTLPENMSSNRAYQGELEFVIIDYNSDHADLRQWVQEEYTVAMQSGLLSFYRTDEPQQYNMAHSRNIGFKVATGDIVCSVDADNYTNEGFAEYVNQLANQYPSKAFFAKGRKNLRGRLGFYKDEFINILGGYDESLTGYGSEDHDLMHRAWGAGLTMCWFGGQFYKGIPESKKHQLHNFDEKDWKYTEKRNKVISCFNLCYKRWYANRKKHWGKAHLLKNFNEEINI